MRSLVGWIGGLVLLIASLSFAAANGAQRVRLDLGLTTLYRVPLALVVFGSLILGMVIMLLVGIQADLKVRRLLKEKLAEEGREERERVDRFQRDLFRPDPEE
ncbi:MAG: lipopolysaccharide assembly protein LapA domain-containing protein [Gemmatimonadota bacterium]